MAIGSACAPRTLVSTFVFVDGAHHTKLAVGAALLFERAAAPDLAVLSDHGTCRGGGRGGL